MDPLVVAGRVGEQVDLVLVDLVPVRPAEVLALRARAVPLVLRTTVAMQATLRAIGHLNQMRW